MNTKPLPWQESAPLAHIFGLTGQEWSLPAKLKFRENTAHMILENYNKVA